MSLYAARKYLLYQLNAKNEHSIHSPFVFRLYTEVIRNQQKYYAYDELEKLRKKLLDDESVIEVTDFGAGSKMLSNRRKVSEIAKVSVIPAKYGELLFRLVNHFQPQSILELGTSLGLSALYMHRAAPRAELITVEGCPDTFVFAKGLIEANSNTSPDRGDAKDFSEAKDWRRGPTLVNARFEDFLSGLSADKKFDLVYIDGNHTYEATTHYFKTLLNHVHDHSVIICDDIYWSAGMTKAWEEIKTHAGVTLTIDLFKVGLVFFRKENKEKEDFMLRY
jgi:predicted O-methyltransferase YrrM